MHTKETTGVLQHPDRKPDEEVICWHQRKQTGGDIFHCWLWNQSVGLQVLKANVGGKNSLLLRNAG